MKICAPTTKALKRRYFSARGGASRNPGLRFIRDSFRHTFLPFAKTMTKRTSEKELPLHRAKPRPFRGFGGSVGRKSNQKIKSYRPHSSIPIKDRNRLFKTWGWNIKIRLYHHAVSMAYL